MTHMGLSFMHRLDSLSVSRSLSSQGANTTYMYMYIHVHTYYAGNLQTAKQRSLSEYST